MYRIHHRRPGLTLIELIVVIALIGTLAGIVLLAAPKFGEVRRVPDAATQLENWIAIARNKAVRDRAPRGLRLVGGPTPTTAAQALYSRFSYVEQPEDITAQTQELAYSNATTFKSMLQDVVNAINQNRSRAASLVPPDQGEMAACDFYRPLIDPNRPNPDPYPQGWKHLLLVRDKNLVDIVKRNDVLEMAGARYTIGMSPLVVPSITGPNACLLVLHRRRDEVRSDAFPLPPIRVTRTPQPVAGEPEFSLPVGVCVDVLYTSTGNPWTRSLPTFDISTPPNGSAGFFEIMFSSSGEVTGSLASAGRIVLWVRDTSLGEPTAGRGFMPPGDNRLIVIHTRNGQVTSHPVNPDVNASGLSDPYKYVRDGKSSRLE